MSKPSTDRESRAWVEVDLHALCANAERVRRAAAGAALLPMVKADAYGLGMTAVARVLEACLPAGTLAGFGVAAVAEGAALRAAGWRGEVLVVAPVAPSELGAAADAGLTLAVSDTSVLRAWAAEAAARGRRLGVHLEIDTGMGRAGFPWRDAARWLPQVDRLVGEALDWVGAFTHFHSADEPDLTPTEQQWSRFRAAVDAFSGLPRARRPHVLHVANSAAALRCSFPCDWVRPGIFLYGGRVGAEPPVSVVAVRARVVRVADAPAGSTVGYGATHVAARAERWATLSVGYGDGVPRSLAAGGGEVLLRARRVPIIGRISMDMTVVDVTGMPEVEVGDVATLIGRDGAEEITLDAVAERVGTISYEILTGLTPRLPRVYHGEPAIRSVEAEPAAGASSLSS